MSNLDKLMIKRLKELKKIQASDYYFKNRDTILKKDKKYREENKEKIKINNSNYYQNNKDKVKAINKKWSDNNFEKRKIIQTRYNLKNPASKNKISEINKRCYNKRMFKLKVQLLINKIKESTFLICCILFSLSLWFSLIFFN